MHWFKFACRLVMQVSIFILLHCLAYVLLIFKQMKLAFCTRILLPKVRSVCIVVTLYGKYVFLNLVHKGSPEFAFILVCISALSLLARCQNGHLSCCSRCVEGFLCRSMVTGHLSSTTLEKVAIHTAFDARFCLA